MGMPPILLETLAAYVWHPVGADEVPVGVVQKVLGHASLQTTSIYVQAEKKRVLEEVAGNYARRAEPALSGKRGH